MRVSATAEHLHHRRCIVHHRRCILHHFMMYERWEAILASRTSCAFNLLEILLIACLHSIEFDKNVKIKMKNIFKKKKKNSSFQIISC